MIQRPTKKGDEWVSGPAKAAKATERLFEEEEAIKADHREERRCFKKKSAPASRTRR